jgi:tetratricopeptide (TPR) repeat protein
MNLQSLIGFVGSLLIFGASVADGAVVLGSEPHGATTRTFDRSNWSSTRSNEDYLSRLITETKLASRRGDYDLVISRCNAALQLHPHKKVTAYLYQLRSGAYCSKHRDDLAMTDADSAIRVDPSSSAGYAARAFIDVSLGKNRSAIQNLDEAIRRNPKDASAYANRGVCFDLLGDVDHAFADYNEAIRLHFEGHAYVNRAQLYLQKHNYQSALGDLESGAKLARNDNEKRYGQVLATIAWVRATCPDPAFRNGKKAVELSTKACELTQWKSARAIEAFAAAYAECGHFDQAIKYQTQAVNLRDSDDGLSQKERSLNDERKRSRLILYRNQQPYRDDFKRDY